jgi:branched-chain amino acid transport system permease protein
VDKFLSFTIIGLATSSIYAVGASGLVLTYTTTGIFNFAHGAIGMLGAFAYWQMRFDWGWPAPVALFAVLGVLMPLFGILLEFAIMKRLQGVSEATKLVVSISLLVACIGLANWLWDPNVGRPMNEFFQGKRIALFSTFVTYHSITVVCVAIVVAIFLRFLLFQTRAGVAMRATVDDRPLAMLNGARPGQIAMMAWAIGASLAALAGILIAPTLALNASTLSLLIVNAYAAAIIGRLRSLPMTFVGALVVGLTESYGIGYLQDWFPRSDVIKDMRPAIPVIILFIALLVLPQARLRGHTAARAREFFPKPSFGLAAFGAGSLVAFAVGASSLMTRSDMLTMANIFGLAIIALSFVPLVGYAGQISLAQLTFAGIGAVTMAHVGHGSPLGLLWAALICGGVGALVALPALRLSGIYLALSTGAFAIAMDRWIFNLPKMRVFDLFSVSFFEQGSIQVQRLKVFGVDFDSERAQLILLASAFAVLALLVIAIRRSSFGYRLVAMKDSEAACATLGMNLTGTKLAAFAFSAALAGVGGALYGGLLGSISPERFQFLAGLPLFMLAVVGGIGSAFGAMFAGIAVAFFPLMPRIVPVAIERMLPVEGWTSPIGHFFDGPVWSFPLEKLVLVLPGVIGISLGMNPSGVVRDFSKRFGGVQNRRSLLAVVVAAEVVLYALVRGDLISNWAWVWLSIVAVGLAPQLAERWEAVQASPSVLVLVGGIDLALVGIIVADTTPSWLPNGSIALLALVAITAAPRLAETIVANREVESAETPLELVGVDRPWTDDDRDTLNAELGLTEAELHDPALV